jgi:hypothetical protein
MYPTLVENFCIPLALARKMPITKACFTDGRTKNRITSLKLHGSRFLKYFSRRK